MNDSHQPLQTLYCRPQPEKVVVPTTLCRSAWRLMVPSPDSHVWVLETRTATSFDLQIVELAWKTKEGSLYVGTDDGRDYELRRMTHKDDAWFGGQRHGAEAAEAAPVGETAAQEVPDLDGLLRSMEQVLGHLQDTSDGDRDRAVENPRYEQLCASLSRLLERQETHEVRT